MLLENFHYNNRATPPVTPETHPETPVAIAVTGFGTMRVAIPVHTANTAVPALIGPKIT